MRKKLVLILAFMMILTTVTVFADTTKFKDIKGSEWFYNDLKEVAEKEIVKGYPDGKFYPDKQLTFAEFIKTVLISYTKNDVGNSEKGGWALNYYNQGLKESLYTKEDIKESM